MGDFKEKIGPSDTLTTELSHWHKLFHHATMDYIDEALQPEFGYLIQFVNETELSLETTDAPMFEKISNQFNPTWRASISTLSSEVMRKFSAAKYASSILQALLSQIVVSWERYHVLLDKKFKKGALPFRNQPVGSQNLMLELKKYQTTY
ncbi:Vacuolar protein sorting-associated protein 52 [Coelomomyces lativittatus]|nr:Vacuolar protein sorting-associated protein 52 [Coelomomyces lativittatus]